jgi:hypothetical protein
MSKRGRYILNLLLKQCAVLQVVLRVATTLIATLAAVAHD